MSVASLTPKPDAPTPAPSTTTCDHSDPTVRKSLMPNVSPGGEALPPGIAATRMSEARSPVTRSTRSPL